MLLRQWDYFYESKVITTSKILAKSIWNTMCKICYESLNESLDYEVEDVESACSIILQTLGKEYELMNMVSDISNIIKNGGIFATLSSGEFKIFIFFMKIYCTKNFHVV